MGFSKFCPKCGKETDTLIKGMCKKCYLRGEDLFRVKDLSIEYCSRCERVRHGFKWAERSDEEIIEGIKSKVRPIADLEQAKIIVGVKQEGDTTYNVRIKVVGLLEGVLVEQEKGFVLELDKKICDPCMKLSSDYREAVLQLRTESGPKEAEEMLKLAEEFVEQEKANDPLSGVVNVLRTKNGFDVWVASSKAGAKVANKLGRLYSVKVGTSKKLIGQEGGKRKYRYTFLVRK